MNKILFVIVMIIAPVCQGISQCNEYYQFDSGSEWEFEVYNEKGKLSGKNHQKVTDFEKTSAGFDATIQSVFYNEKGKELMKGDVAFKCAGGTAYIDMRNFVSEDMLKAFSSFEMKVESENLELPSKLSEGQTLKNGSILVSAVNSPFPMSISVTISDRKVVGKETITTPAGTFECFKITSKSTIKNQMGMSRTFEMTSTEWIAPKAGVVKSESYKNGKLNGSTILTMRK